MGRKRRMPCFCAIECVDGGCPNVQYEAADDKWGAGIADDLIIENYQHGEQIKDIPVAI